MPRQYVEALGVALTLELVRINSDTSLRRPVHRGATHRDVMKSKGKGVLDAAIAKTIGYAVLEPDEKKEIHKHIEKIRALVEGSGLEDRKKNNLFTRLSDLALEVNRNGTRTDRFFALASELGFSIGQFTKDAKPAIDELKDILKIVTKARARHEGLKLPAGDEILLLPEPVPTE